MYKIFCSFVVSCVSCGVWSNTFFHSLGFGFGQRIQTGLAMNCVHAKSFSILSFVCNILLLLLCGKKKRGKLEHDDCIHLSLIDRNNVTFIGMYFSCRILFGMEICRLLCCPGNPPYLCQEGRIFN